MSYQVIARKYRPQRFADVVGQEHVTQTLANAILQKRIAHAYLFVGPRGTGKTTIARIFSKCLNCTGGPKVDFPDDDPRCVEISEGRSLDVLEIDGASNRGIEEIRALRETVKYAPSSSSYKIYIIDEVHMLTKEAFNALLKTLEEPPEHVKFMFATTEPEKVLATILSRCQRYDLRRISVGMIAKHLGYISKQENVSIDEAALHAIARGADGCMRDAESTLDQLISFCGNQIAENDVLSMFGLAARNQIQGLAGAILAGNLEATLRTLDELSRMGKDLSRLLGDLLNHFRNLLLHQIARGDTTLLEVSEAEAAVLASQSALVGQEGLTRIMETLADGDSRLRDAAIKRIVIEITLVKAVQAKNAVSLDSVLKILGQMRAEGGAEPVAKPLLVQETAMPAKPAPVPVAAPPVAPPAPATVLVAPVTPVPAPVAPAPTVEEFPPNRSHETHTTYETHVVAEPQAAPAPAVAPPAPPKPEPKIFPAAPAKPAAVVQDSLLPMDMPVVEALSPDRLNDLWQQVVEAVGRVSPFTRTYLLQAHLVSFEKRVFVIGFEPQFADHIELVDNSKNKTMLLTKLKELGQDAVQIKFVKADGPSQFKAPVEAAAKPAPVSKPVAPVTPAAPKTPAASTSPAPSIKASKPASDPVMTKEDFKNDPLIKQALEIFKGQIVEIRA